MIYPFHELPTDIVHLIRKDSVKADANKLLTTQQLEIIYQNKWFHLFVPERYGGLGLSLPEGVRLEEQIAYADGSLGWVVTLCAGANMFVGYFDAKLASDVFVNPRVCFAGSGQASGIARAANNIIETHREGYIMSGRWPYASGAPYATHFTANCVIENTDKTHSFLFKKDEVELHPDWDYLGLQATAGYSFSIKDKWIPAERMFNIDPAATTSIDPVYKYPFMQFAETTIAANISGMCRYFFEQVIDLLKQKPDNAYTQPKYTKGLELAAFAIKETDQLRDAFYAALDRSWSMHASGKTLSPAELGNVSSASRHLSRSCRQLVNELYPYCGMEAAKTGSLLNLVWRNINTASQHSLLV